MADLAKLLINIDGKSHAKNLTIEKSFDTQTVGNGVFEQKYSVTTAQSPIVIPMSNKLGTLNTLFLKSSSATEEITLTLYIDNGVDPAYTKDITFIEFAVINLGSTLFGYLTQIDLATSSSSQIDIEVRAYI